MKLVSKKKKLGLIIGAVAVALIAIIAVVIVIVSIPKEPDEPPVTMQGINISTFPKLKYYVGDEFDPSGIKVQAVMSKQSATYFVDESELEFSGFDSSVAVSELPITVSYQGYTTTFNVEVKEIPTDTATKTLESIKLSANFKTTYKLDKWNFYGPDFYGVSIILYFSDGSQEVISADYRYFEGYDTKLTSAGTHNLIVKYTYGGTEVRETIPITITN